MVNEILNSLSETSSKIIEHLKKESKKHYKKLYQRQYRASKKYDLALQKYVLTRSEFEEFQEKYKRMF